jgi:hypothetical protein
MWPQVPQFLASLNVSTHAPEQTFGSVDGQRQKPLLQVALDGQTRPQRPQLLRSVCRFTQAPPHAVMPVGQVRAHCPPTQLWPLEQRLPQAPQLFRSVPVLTQLPVQRVSWVFVQTQAPPVQL